MERWEDAIAIARLAFVCWKGAERPSLISVIAGFLSITFNDVETSAAHFCRTLIADGGWGAVKHGVLCFMMPPLCQAISSIVFPSMAV